MSEDPPVLSFERAPIVTDWPQHTLDGRVWRIVRVVAPDCWATPYGTSGVTKWRFVVVKRPARLS